MKRFTDTAKWQPWFRKLTLGQRLFWFFILDKCDSCGAWERDDAQVALDIDPDLDIDQALDALNAERERIRPLKGGKILFVVDFIRFQYSRLRKENKVHSPAYRDLARNGLDPYPYEIDESKGFTKTPEGTLQSLQEEEEEEEEEKNKEKEEKGKEVRRKTKVDDFEAEIYFDELWKEYPNKIDKPKSKERFLKSVKTLGDLEMIREALRRYLKHLEVNDWKKPQDGKTWFNNWRGWVDYEEPPQKQDEKDDAAKILERLKS